MRKYLFIDRVEGQKKRFNSKGELLEEGKRIERGYSESADDFHLGDEVEFGYLMPDLIEEDEEDFDTEYFERIEQLYSVDTMESQEKDDPPAIGLEEVLRLKPKLKQLPAYHKYVFLSDDEFLPVIISSSLTKDQDEKLVEVLNKYKEAIGSDITDIKGISPVR